MAHSPGWRELRDGIMDYMTLIVALVPIGVLFGALATNKGLSVLEATMISAFVFAGASQFVALELWADPAPILVLTATVFIVNIRHTLMGLSLARHMDGFYGPVKWTSLFFLTDEAWALCERRVQRRKLHAAYYIGVAVSLWVFWVGTTIVGAMLGRAIGDPALIGLDFAFAALFLVILSGFWKGPRSGFILAASGLVSVLSKQAFDGAWYIVLGGMAGMAVAVVQHRWKVQSQKGKSDD